MANLFLFLIFPTFWIENPAGDVRTWTHSSGKGQVEAEMVSSQPGKVWLRRSDGEVFAVPLDALSDRDRRYVRDRLEQEEAAKSAPAPTPPGRIPYAAARRLATLANGSVDESSGLACSRRRAGLFWTHNDSGDDARIYLFDTEGRDLGSCALKGVQAFDWEDLASFEADGKKHLLVCDVGNNGLAAAVQILYLVEEPPCDAEQGVTVRELPVVQTVYYSYEDDHRNCEAVAVDPTTKTLLFVTKEREAKCYAYALPWPEGNPKKALVARRIGTLELPLVTSMDVSPDGRRAVVLTYGNAYEFVREEDEDWAAAFARPPRELVMPRRLQGETICYGLDGKTLYLTSEKLPTPLWEVPALEDVSRGKEQ
ncbi:MAG: SHD1 domain-containing protein [Planctomycetota bacterium]|jgi:hypothetical protein